MSFLGVIVILVWAAIIAFFLYKNYVGEALVILFFTPFPLIFYTILTPSIHEPLSHTFAAFTDKLQDNLLPISLWVTAFIFVQLWRIGFLQEAFHRIRDMLRTGSPTGYTPLVTANGNPLSAALMGTSTENFTKETISIREATLIKLTVFSMATFNRQTHMSLEAQLNAPRARRKKIHNFISQTLDSRAEQLPQIVRPFLRDTAGNYDIPRRILRDLCAIAASTGNMDPATESRLSLIARHLGLPETDIAHSLRRF
ncbi:MAG: hypothetical protein ACSHXY_13570 [Alphaproteobacteria bacterium]